MGAIHHAARTGDVGALQLLLCECGRAVNAMDEQEHRPPLSLASGQGHLEAVQFLLDRGATIDLRGHNGGTALMWACANGHEGIAMLLLSRGADPTVRDHVGLTALMESARGDGRGFPSLIRAMLNDGRARVDERDIVGRTALYWACFYGCSEAARVLLVEGGADHTLADNGGQTPMAIALERGQQGCVDLLQWFEGELDRAYTLAKTRKLEDDREAIRQAPSKVDAREWEEAHKARWLAAPSYLKRRVERGEMLPRVSVLVEEEGGGEEKKRARPEEEEGGVGHGVAAAVLAHVVDGMKEDPFLILMDMVRYR